MVPETEKGLHKAELNFGVKKFKGEICGRQLGKAVPFWKSARGKEEDNVAGSLTGKLHPQKPRERKTPGRVPQWTLSLHTNKVPLSPFWT